MKMKEKKKKIKPYYFLITLSCIAVLMLIVIAPANAGVSPEEGKYVGNNGAAVIGETKLTFLNESWQIIPSGKIKSAWEGSNIIIPFNVPFDSSRDEDKLVEGDYWVIGPNGNITISFYSPRLDVKTKIGGEEVTKVTKGDDITFEADTNLWLISNLSYDFWVFEGPLPNYITYKLIDPDGVQRHEASGVSLSDITVDHDGINSTTINTAGLKTGVYTLSIETDPATNNGLDIEGPPVSFTVEAGEITIEAEPTEEVVNEDIVFTVSTSPNTNIILNVTSGMVSKVQFRRDIFGVDVSKDGHSASGTSDEGGNFTAVAYFTGTGSYEITATEPIANTKASVTVIIKEFSASVSTDKSKYYIGEPVEITGSANADGYVTIKIDDMEIETDVPLSGGKFSHIWTTTEDVSPGSYEVGIWVLPFSDPFKDPPDASVSVIFIRGGLSAKLYYTGIKKEIIQEIVAQGDDFEIKGVAPGRDNVDIVTIAPKGGSGNGFDPTDIFGETGGALDVPGLTYSTSPVSHGKADFGAFTKKIDVGKDVDTGMYLVIALNPGRDEVYGSSAVDILTVITGYDFSIKTQDQILAILKEETINHAGSDDLLWVGTIKVENPWVTLNDIEDVHLGDDIVVSGISNRRNGFLFLITVEGPTDLIPQFASNDVSTAGGTFTASFSTVSAKVGKYTVTVDNSDGHTDTKTVNILPAITPSFNISGTPIPASAAMHESKGTNESVNATQVATPTQTSPSTKTGTKKKPDFVLIFTIAGAGILVAVSAAWLVIRKRREKVKWKRKGMR